MCNTCDKALNLAAPETFWQLLMENGKLCEQQTSGASMSAAHSSASTSPRSLSYIEENAVRYTAGYVLRKLERKYCCRNTKESTECSMALKEMAGKLTTRDTMACTSNQRSSEWTRHTDRGGLYHVDVIVYELFVAIELLVDKELSAIFESKGKGLEKVKKEKLSWVCNNDEVQFLWCMISPSALECEDIHQSLLREIAHLWITTRGYSKVRRIKEDYKADKGKTVRGKIPSVKNYM